MEYYDKRNPILIEHYPQDTELALLSVTREEIRIFIEALRNQLVIDRMPGSTVNSYTTSRLLDDLEEIQTRRGWV